MTFDLALHAKQGEAITSRATEILYGGAAGGGKSYLMRAAAISWAMRVPGLQIYLFRRLSADLISNHMVGEQSFPSLLAPLVAKGLVRIVKNEIRFLFNGAKIHLEYCQHEKDITAYDGYEMHVILIDELTHWTDRMYRYLRSRSRMSAEAKAKVPDDLKGTFPRILCGTNPGGVGHHWVKKTFRPDKPWTLRRMGPKEGGKIRQFIPAVLEDNPSLDAEEYTATLSGMGDTALVKAKLKGDWNVVAGSMYGDAWDYDRHTCKPFDIPLGWKIWRGGDDGFASHAAVVWLTQDPDTKTYYVIDELYADRMLPDLFAERTLLRDKAIVLLGAYGTKNANLHRIGGVMDSAAFVRTGQSDTGQEVKSRGEQMNALGCDWEPADKPPGSRIQRCQNLHRLLAQNPKDPRKRPGIVFFENCVETIRTIPALPRDHRNPDDVDTKSEDHLFDALTYAFQYVVAGSARVKTGGT